MKYFILIGMLYVLCGCKSADYRFMEGKIYGTYYRIAYQSEQDFSEALQEQMESVNRSLSMFNRSSVISRVNRGETDEVDSLFIRMFTVARQVNQQTNGAFDITVAPLVNAWGFGYKHRTFPVSGTIDSLLQYVGLEKLRLENGRLIKERAGIELDASSIAKGLGVDLVADYLDACGVKNYMVDIGGEIRVAGISDKDRAWRVGIDKPVDDSLAMNRELQLIVNLQEGALATSGNYRNFYMKDGKKYAHTINPKTGYPVQRDILSSTVYAPTCMEADAYATAFMVLGLEESKKIAEANPEIEVCFVYEQDGQYKSWMTDNFTKLVMKE